MKCESCCRYGLPCKNPAKWVTPSHKFATGGVKVCGVHKYRFETYFHKCTKVAP